MKTLLFIPTASIEGDKPSTWFKQILDEAIQYASNGASGEIIFLVTGKWNNAKDKIGHTEAEIGKRYIKSHLPEANVVIEELALETGGNFAFSKPMIDRAKPDLVVIFNSMAKEERTKYFARKIFGPDYKIEFVFVKDIFSENPRAVAKEPKALSMFKKLFDPIKDGDDQSAREILLNKTPFYNWDVVENEKFFDENWPGGFADFKEKRLSIDNK